MSKIDYTERNRSIYENRKNGDSYAKIGRDHGVSAERVKQIIFSQQREEKRRSTRDEFLKNNDILDLPIELTDLSVRSINCLKNNRLNAVRDIIDLNFEDYQSLRIPNFGNRSADECKAFVEKVRRDNGNNQ